VDCATNIQAVLQEFTPLLSRIAASYEFDASLQEDLLQDISLAVWRALDSFRGDAKLKTFVAKIAHNRCIDHVIKQKRTTGKWVELDERDIVDKQSVADSMQQKRDASLDLFSALHKLAIANRQVITMQLEGFSYLEIANVLGISEAAVTKRAARAKQQLEQWL
jgi:RNA polymerase sigma-70 factor (ECF subfamily)